MALVYLTVNGTTLAISRASYQAPAIMQNGQDNFIVAVDDSVAGVTGLLTNPASTTYDKIQGTNMYVTSYYTGSNLIVNVVNPPATNAPTTVPVSICGQVINAPLTSNTATIPIAIHPSVTYANVPAAILLTGTSPVMVQLGGTNNGQPVNMYKDTSGNYHVAPTSQAYLASYYTSQAFNQAYAMIDAGTWLGILTDLIVTYMLPNMEQATYTPLSITGNASDSLTDIKTNLLPNIFTALAAAAPAGAAKDPHYNSVVTHQTESKTVATDFLTAAAQIPWMV